MQDKNIGSYDDCEYLLDIFCENIKEYDIDNSVIDTIKEKYQYEIDFHRLILSLASEPFGVSVLNKCYDDILSMKSDFDSSYPISEESLVILANFVDNGGVSISDVVRYLKNKMEKSKNGVYKEIYNFIMKPMNKK